MELHWLISMYIFNRRGMGRRSGVKLGHCLVKTQDLEWGRNSRMISGRDTLLLYIIHKKWSSLVKGDTYHSLQSHSPKVMVKLEPPNPNATRVLNVHKGYLKSTINRARVRAEPVWEWHSGTLGLMAVRNANRDISLFQTGSRSRMAHASACTPP